MIDSLANFFLSFGHVTLIFPVVVLGYIWLSRSFFYHAITLIFLSMMVSFALKVTFKIPLPPLLKKEGFGFPSGHMQMATVLYG